MADYTLSAKLTADPKGFQKGFDKAKSSLANLQEKSKTVGTKFKNLGKQMSGLGDSLTRKITVPATLATTALAGITGALGWKRLAGLDAAKAQLEGLGYNTEEVGKITEQVTKAIDGGMTTMAEGTSTAAGALAAGVEEGKELERYIKLVGDAAVGANRPVDEMAQIFNRVQGQGKLMTQELNMIEMGLPGFAQSMADNVADGSMEAFREMVTNGEVGSDEFLNVMEDFAGGMADAYSKSWSGMAKNTAAYIGIIGENLLGGVFQTSKEELGNFIDLLKSDEVMDWAERAGQKIGDAFNSIVDSVREAKQWFDDLSPAMQNLTLKAVGIGAAFLVGIGPALKIAGALSGVLGTVFSVLGFLLSPIGLVVGAIVGLGVAFGVAMKKSETFRNKVMEIFDRIKDIVSDVISTVGPILSKMWDKGKDSAASFAESLGGTLLNAFEVIVDVVGAVVDAVGQFVSSIMEGFDSAGGKVNDLSALFMGFSPVLKVAMIVLKDFGPQIAESFQQIVEMALPILTLLGETIGQLAAEIIPLLLNVINTLVPIIMELGMAIMDIITEALPIFLEIFQQLVPVAMSLVETIIGIVTQLIPLVSVIIDSVIPVVMQLISSFMEIVQAVAPALIAIIRAVIDIFDAIIPIVMAVLTTVIQVMANIIAAITPIISFVAGVISSIVSIISPIVTFIAGIISSIFSAIQPITSFVSGVFNTVFSVVSSVFRSIMNFISSAISTISGIISKLSGTVSGVFNSIFGTVSGIMSKVSSTISGVFSAIQGAWNGLTGMVSNIFSGISSSVSTLVGQVKGFINGVIGGINSAIGLINKIPGVKIGTIPELARGTDDWPGGFARMNEGGRGELVKLPDGTQVIPHDVSMKFAREAGKQSGGQAGNTQYVPNVPENEKRGDIVFNVDGYELARIQEPYLDKMFGDSIDLSNYMKGVRG